MNFEKVIVQIKKEFPQEYYIELIGLSPALQGRVSLFKQNESINAEIDIIQGESGKIYSHVKSVYNYDDPRELLDTCVHYLKEYLDKNKK